MPPLSASRICYDKAMVDTPDSDSSSWFSRLVGNNRFWILALAITGSVIIAGFVQLQIPDTTLQSIRIGQAFGFLSLALLYLAMLISPLTKVFTKLPGREGLVYARRAIGVSAFYYAVLHVYITFFDQLNGFGGIAYLNPTYGWSLLSGIFALGVLCSMAATSFDWVVAKMGYRQWKMLHRLVYAASVAILVHLLLIGSHFANGVTILGVVTYAAVGLLVVLEVVRIGRVVLQKRLRDEKER